MTTPCSIIACGMINPLGVGAQAVLAAVRANICQYQQSGLISKDHQPFKLALVPQECLPELDEDLAVDKSPHYQRLIKLACIAIKQARQQLDCDQPLPLLIALASTHNMAVQLDFKGLLADIALCCENIIDIKNSRYFNQGRAGGIAAFQAGKALIDSGLTDSVLVGGVDSYLDLMQLSLLDQQQRLLTDASMDGFVPGEGAAFFVLNNNKNHKITLGISGLCDEPGHMYSEETCLGTGLSQAIQTAVNSGSKKVKTIFSGFNGEHAGGKEWGIALNRNSQAIEDSFAMVHPADCYGDLGAATIPSLMILAYLGLLQNHYPSPLLIWSAADFSERGAILMTLNE